MRRSLMLVGATATALVASASAAVGQAYPPTPSNPGNTTSGVKASTGGSGLAFTGSDLTLLWVGLIVLVIGVALFVATRRRAGLRRRGALREV